MGKVGRTKGFDAEKHKASSREQSRDSFDLFTRGKGFTARKTVGWKRRWRARKAVWWLTCKPYAANASLFPSREMCL